MLLKKQNLKKRMKKTALTFSILFCSFCLTFCKHNSTDVHYNAFKQPEINPLRYEQYNKEKIDLQDASIIQKIHSLDCLFDSKVRAGFNGSVLISYKGTPIFE